MKGAVRYIQLFNPGVLQVSLLENVLAGGPCPWCWDLGLVLGRMRHHRIFLTRECPSSWLRSFTQPQGGRKQTSNNRIWSGWGSPKCFLVKAWQSSVSKSFVWGQHYPLSSSFLISHHHYPDSDAPSGGNGSLGSSLPAWGSSYGLREQGWGTLG